MLETLNAEGFERLRKSPGVDVRLWAVAQSAPGMVIRAITHSGNCYLFEIIHPLQRLGHVVRCDSRGGVSRGYRGVRTLSAEFRLEEVIIHESNEGPSHTTPVKELTIIDPLVL